MYELYNNFNEITDILINTGNDVNVLSKTPSWDCVQLTNYEEDKNSDGVIGTINKAKNCLFNLKGILTKENTTVNSVNSLVQSLSLELAQSKRERASLELQLKDLKNSLLVS